MRTLTLLAIPLASLFLAIGCQAHPKNCTACGIASSTQKPQIKTAGSKPSGTTLKEGKTAYLASAEAKEINPEKGAVLLAENVDRPADGSVVTAVELAEANVRIDENDPETETMTAEAYLALIKSGKVSDPDYRAPGSETAERRTPMSTASAPTRAQSAEAVEQSSQTTPTMINASATVAAGEGIRSSSYIPKIPGMPLPDGWGYINEKDLVSTHESNDAIAGEKYFSSATRAKSTKNNILL